MSAFERAAIQRLVDRAVKAGLPVPAQLTDIMDRLDGDQPTYPAREWARLHPDAIPCCEASGYTDLERCTCWTPVYAVDQQPACPPPADGSPAGFSAATRMCRDCAYRPGSPERSVGFEETNLLAMAADLVPFYCHTGMRQPARWEHPAGRTLPGHPDDWHPLIVDGIPYQADGSPGLLCAGWAAIAARRGPVRPDIEHA